MNMKKKLLARALALFTALTMLSTTAFAHVVTIDGVEGTTDVETVRAGVNAIAGSESKSGNIQLTGEAKENVTITSGNVTINLNGNTITGTGIGSVIKVTGDGTKLTVTDSGEGGTITGGKATFGGGINVSGKDASVTLEGGTISGNTATANGGGVYVENGKFTMNGGTISGNNGGNAGGGVHVNTTAAGMQNSEATFVMNGGTISGNTATSGGGVGAYAGWSQGKDYRNNGEGSYVAVDINGGTITGNTATTGDGGGVAAQDNTVEISNAVISNNTAGNIGGGIWLANSTTTITDSKVTGNEVTSTISTNNGGGGIFAGGKTLEISTTEISGNTSSTFGGGISGNASMTLTGTTVKNNTANSYGGGIYTNGTTVTVTGGEISNNEANRGGGIYAYGGASVNVRDAGITGNKVSGANAYGGGIYASGAATNITLTGGNVSDNEAEQGGGIFGWSATVNMESGNITGNTAKTIGGGVRLYDGARFTMSGGEIHSNSAGTHSDDILSNGTNSSTIILLPAASMNVIGADGKPITGWYYDGTDRYGNGDKAYLAQNDATLEGGYTGTLCLKAAHDEYFHVVYTDGNGGTLQDTEVENKSGIPVYEGDALIREGYNFIGWTISDGTEIDWDTATVNGALTLVPVWEAIPEPEQPEEPETPENPDDVTIPDADIPMADAPDAADADVTVDDEATPLSGIVTLAELLEALRQHEEIAEIELPEDFKFIDHEYAQAIYWALAESLVVDTEEEPLDPDEIVTVELMQEVLDNFAMKSLPEKGAAKYPAALKYAGEIERAVCQAETAGGWGCQPRA